MKVILILLICTSQVLNSQIDSRFSGNDTSNIDLQECYELARANYPLIKSFQTEEQITKSRIENLSKNYYPGFSLFGQTQYLSDVTKIELPIQIIDIPTIPNDQYKIGVSVNQILWDGGFTSIQKNIEDEKGKSQALQIEIELYKLKQKINEAFFNILIVDNRIKSLNLALKDLSEKLFIVRERVMAGIILASNENIIEAEVLKLKQNLDELVSFKSTALHILSELIGKNINEKTELILPDADTVIINNALNRPEYDLFRQSRYNLIATGDLIDVKRMPKFSATGQMFYGRPGLNMLDPDFQFNYLASLQFSWSPWNWNETKIEHEIVDLQKELISTQEETFTKNIKIAEKQILNNIKMIKSQIEKDESIISLRQKIVKQFFSQLQNGVITSSEYMIEFNAELRARQDMETRKLKLIQEYINYKTLYNQ